MTRLCDMTPEMLDALPPRSRLEDANDRAEDRARNSFTKGFDGVWRSPGLLACTSEQLADEMNLPNYAYSIATPTDGSTP